MPPEHVPVLCNWLRKRYGSVVGEVLEASPGITVLHLSGLSLPCICAADSRGTSAGSGKALQGRLKEEPSSPTTGLPCSAWDQDAGCCHAGSQISPIPPGGGGKSVLVRERLYQSGSPAG